MDNNIWVSFSGAVNISLKWRKTLNSCRQSFNVIFKGTKTKLPQQTTAQQQTQNKTLHTFDMNYFGWFIASSMKIGLFQQMLSKHFCTVNEVHCGFVSIKNTSMSSNSFTVSIVVNLIQAFQGRNQVYIRYCQKHKYGVFRSLTNFKHVCTYFNVTQ